MSEKTANLEVTTATDCVVGGVCLSFRPGKHLVPEDVCDRVVAAGHGVRIKPRGKHFEGAEPASAAGADNVALG